MRPFSLALPVESYWRTNRVRGPRALSWGDFAGVYYAEPGTSISLIRSAFCPNRQRQACPVFPVSAILDRTGAGAGAGAGRGNFVGLRQPGCQYANWKCRAANRQGDFSQRFRFLVNLSFPRRQCDSVGLLDSSMVSGMVAVNHRLDARSSMSVNADYSTFSYSGSGTGLSPPDIETRGINLSYQRLLSRTLSINVSGGPQWVSSSNSTLIPSDVNAAVSAGLIVFARTYERIGGLFTRRQRRLRSIAGSAHRQCLCFPRAYLWPQVGAARLQGIRIPPA